MSTKLFSGQTLKSVLQIRLDEARYAVEALTLKDFATGLDDDLMVERLLTPLRVAAPKLDRDGMTLAERQEKVRRPRDPSADDRRGESMGLQDMVDLYVPFSGDETIFSISPDMDSDDRPHGQLRLGELVIPVEVAGEPGTLRDRIDGELRRLQAHLDAIDDQAFAEQQGWLPELRRLTTARRAGLTRKAAAIEATGIPRRD